jgi:phosphomannomutase
MERDELRKRLREEAGGLGVPAETLAQAEAAHDWFLVPEWIIPRRAQLPAAQAARSLRAAEALLRLSLLTHPAGSARGKRVPVVFGTGGHRGEIGWGLTLAHVHAILTALMGLIAGQSPAERREHFGSADLAEVKRKGMLIGHDNRLFNPEFSYYAAHVLGAGGYRVAYAGRIATPELSYLVPAQGWAGSVNFTPSHNPFRYGGIKLSPADGGLAGPELTDPLEHEANRLLDALTPGAWPAPDALERMLRAQEQGVARVDLHEDYLRGLECHPVIRLDDLVRTLKGLPPAQALHWVVDPVWGASVPAYLRLRERLGASVLTLLHTEDDPYFGGQTTEPNEQTLGEAVAAVRAHGAPLKVAIRNDPDSDRGLVGDAAGAIKMNRFAPLVLRYLLDLGLDGGLVTTLPTSHMGPDYAARRGKAVTVTKTGFKNFRPLLRQGRTLVAYEESDGMTIQGHTLDKDGLLAGLLAVRIVLHYGRALSDLLAEMEAELGVYYWRQMTFMIDMTAREAHRRLQGLAAVQPGRRIQAGGQERAVAAVNTEDGFKFVLDDGSWMMMRPSGTEPKVRVYAETRESGAATEALCEAAKALALEAIRASA